MRVTVQLDADNMQMIELPANATLDELRTAPLSPNVQKGKKQIDNARKMFKLVATDGKEETTLRDGSSLKDQGVLENGSIIKLKVLPPQVGYRTVFIVEYAGPLLAALICSQRPSFIYGATNAAAASSSSAGTYTSSQHFLWASAFCLHFIKRELESVLVHKFSRGTMPLSNLWRNSAYYWSFGAALAYFLWRPDYTPQEHKQLSTAAAAVWCLAQLGNLYCHVFLAGQRKGDGDQTRRAPTAFPFSLALCANYTFEVLGWTAFTIGAFKLGSLAGIASGAFTVVGLAQMTQWALGKKAGYVKAQPELKHKAAIIPGII